MLVIGGALAALVVFIAGVGVGAAGDATSPPQAEAAFSAPTATVTKTAEATVPAQPRATVTAVATKTVKKRVVKTVTAEPQALVGGGSGGGGSGGGGACAPGYDPCIPPYPPDVNCPDVDGPIYVTGSDPHGLDADNDGVACES